MARMPKIAGGYAAVGISGRGYTLPMHPYPGKFEGEPRITPILWSLSLDGSDTVGDSAEGWSYTLIEAPITPEELSSAAREYGVEELTPEEMCFPLDIEGAILAEDSQGFVTAHYYTDREELMSQWEACSESDREEY